MSLLLEVENTPTLIIKPSLVPDVHTDDLGWYITSNQQGQMFIQNLAGLSADKMVRQGRFCIVPQTALQLTWCYRKTLELLHKFGIACVIEMTSDRTE